jgi:nucleoside-diphosphate-sugar epimerase
MENQVQRQSVAEPYEHIGAEYCNRRILVTGGAGAIGSNLTAALAGAGAERVLVLDDLSSAEKWNLPSLPNVVFVQGSILDEAILDRIFGQRPQIVFHLAALFANQNSIEHPQRDLIVNAMGTLRLLQHAHQAGVTRFVYASSSSSFSKSKAPLPLREDFISLHLDTPYQITKLMGELYCNFFGSHYGLNTVRTRFFNSYGPGEVPGRYRNVIPNFIFSAMQGRPLTITGTGQETRDFTYVGDIVSGLLLAGCHKEALHEDFNLASGRETRIIDLVNLVNDLTNNAAGIVFKHRRNWDKTTRRWASIDKANALLGYRPQTTLEDGLRKTIQWFGQNWDRILASQCVESAPVGDHLACGPPAAVETASGAEPTTDSFCSGLTSK